VRKKGPASTKSLFNLCYANQVFIFIGFSLIALMAYNLNDNLVLASSYFINSNIDFNLKNYDQPKILLAAVDDNTSFSDSSNADKDTSNNFNPNDDNDNNNNMMDSFGTESKFGKDLSGKYSNSKYGVTELMIPNGWYATESMNGYNGLILTILPAKTEDFFTRLNTLSQNEILPIMNLIIQDRGDLNERQRTFLLGGEPSTLSTTCTELEPNSTSTIDDKNFQVSTLNCSTSDNDLTPGSIDFGHDEIIKSYKYESPTTIYVLQLVLSSEYSATNQLESASLSSFQSNIDNAIQTLRIR